MSPATNNPSASTGSRAPALVASVPPDVSGSVFGVKQPVAIVTGVVTGSPAYNAGLRAGDRVVTCDGQAVDSVQDIRDAVGDRVRVDYPEAPLLDLAEYAPNQQAGERNGNVSLEVVGPLGRHEASIPITNGLDGQTRFYIPIVTDYRSRVNSARWSFLDFIFQFGFNYESTYVPSATRRSQSATTFSMLPFGMFEYSGSPEWTEWTFFWFITISG